MLEVINGFLLIYFVVLCTLSALVPLLVTPIMACLNRPSKKERTVWAQIQEMKAEQKSISMKDEFAAYSKFQRKINKLEDNLKEIYQSRISKSVAIKSSLQIILQIAIALVTLASVIWYRREPIVTLEGDLFPIATLLRYPSEMPNAISTHVWVLISNLSLRTLLKPIVS